MKFNEIYLQCFLEIYETINPRIKVLENSMLGRKDFNPRRKSPKNSTLGRKDFNLRRKSPKNSTLGRKDFNPRRKSPKNSTLGRKDFSPKGSKRRWLTAGYWVKRGGEAAPFYHPRVTEPASFRTNVRNLFYVPKAFSEQCVGIQRFLLNPKINQKIIFWIV